MNWINLFFLKSIEWLKPRYKIEFLNDLPEKTIYRTIYIIGTQDPWLLIFECPCGCKNTIQLNLLKDSRPRWKYVVTGINKITISPSIRRIGKCKSHFFIIKGKTKWMISADYRKTR